MILHGSHGRIPKAGKGSSTILKMNLETWQSMILRISNLSVSGQLLKRNMKKNWAIQNLCSYKIMVKVGMTSMIPYLNLIAMIISGAILFMI